MSTPDIPAGWQPDPRGRHEYRYWDGTQWTDNVSDQGQTSTDPVADTAPAASDAEKSQIFSGESSGSTESAPAAEAPATEVQPVADDPADVQPPIEADPEPVPTFAAATPPAASSAPPGGTTPTPTPAATPAATRPASSTSEAKAAAQDALQSRSPELATVLTAAVPGSGHFYMGTDKVPLAAGLLVATLVGVVLSHISFIMFLIGFVLWLGAVVFGLTDLRGSAGAVLETKLEPQIVGILLIGAGALLIISLLLPYYRVSFDVGPGFGGASGSVNAFDALGIEPIILLVVGILSIVGGAASLGLGPVSSDDLPEVLPRVIAIGGAIAVVIVLFRMFIDGADTAGVDGVKIGRAFGMWLSLWSAIILTLANLGLLRSLTNK